MVTIQKKKAAPARIVIVLGTLIVLAAGALSAVSIHQWQSRRVRQSPPNTQPASKQTTSIPPEGMLSTPTPLPASPG